MQWFVTLSPGLDSLDAQRHTVFGEVAEGFECLLRLSDTFCAQDGRPYKEVRILHTLVLHDPFDDPPNMDRLCTGPFATVINSLIEGRVASNESGSLGKGMASLRAGKEDASVERQSEQSEDRDGRKSPVPTSELLEHTSGRPPGDVRFIGIDEEFEEHPKGFPCF